MVKATKLNKELIAGLEAGDKLVCRKKIVYFGDKCFRKGGVYNVSTVRDDNTVVVYDEMDERFTVNGIMDYSKHFYVYEGKAEDLKTGDKIVLTSKIVGQFSNRFKKGKVYEVYNVNSLGEYIVKTEQGGLIALNGIDDLTGYFVKVK